MFKSALFIFLLTFSFLVHGQNFQTVEEVNNACAQLGFASNEEAEIIVDRVLAKVGLFRNFIIQECPEINNAVAKNITSSTGEVLRYILYDKDFFKRISEKAENDWAAISILAHEISHHLNGHALNNSGSNHKVELEADYSSGFYLSKMGATLEEAQSAIQTLQYEKATHTHPAKVDRLKAIESGWYAGKPDLKPEKEKEPIEGDFNPPIFQGCKGEGQELLSCFSKSIIGFIQENFNTEIVLKLGFMPICSEESRVYDKSQGKFITKCLRWKPVKIMASFIVLKDGSVKVKGISAAHFQLQEETRRVLNSLPKMKPATVDGNPINIEYQIPISFAVTD